MPTIATPAPALLDLLQRLDQAAERSEPHCICSEVKTALTEIISSDSGRLLPAPFLAPVAEGYARRLVHHDPDDRYSVLAMVWGPGQGTPLHDHAGSWCVEGVVRGRIRVTSYDLAAEPEGELFAFMPVQEVVAGRGAAGALIPPFEYHTIDNPWSEAAVTLHVYAGEMTWCHAFHPIGEGRFRRERRELAYTAA